jgi:hypothetical protein
MFLKKKQEPETNDSDMFFDAKEFHTSNKEVANILSNDISANAGGGSASRAAAGASTLSQIEGNWGEEDEIDIDAEIQGDSS